MKHPLRHILKKDFARLRPVVAVLAGVLLIKAALLVLAGHMPVHFGEPILLNQLAPWVFDSLFNNNNASQITFLFIAIILYLDYLVLLALILGLLNEDSPLSDRAFWRTRPISGRQMLAAKLVFIALIIWPGQIALQIAATALAGYPRELWLNGLGELALTQAGYAAVIMIVAVMWKNLYVGFGALFLVFLTYVTTLDRYDSAPAEPLVFLLVVLAPSLAWLMYARRQRMIGFAVLALGIGLLFCLRVAK